MQGLWTHSRPSESKCHFQVSRQFVSTFQLVSPRYLWMYLLSHHLASCCSSAFLVWNSSGSWATPVSRHSPTSFPLRAYILINVKVPRHPSSPELGNPTPQDSVRLNCLWGEVPYSLCDESRVES